MILVLLCDIQASSTLHTLHCQFGCILKQIDKLPSLRLIWIFKINSWNASEYRFMSTVHALAHPIPQMKKKSHRANNSDVRKDSICLSDIVICYTIVCIKRNGVAIRKVSGQCILQHTLLIFRYRLGMPLVYLRRYQL